MAKVKEPIGFKVFDTPCKNCLLSKERLVSPERAKEMVKSCIKDQTHFICHKAQLNGQGDVCCKTFFDKIGDKINKIRVFKSLKMIVFVKHKNSKKLTSYKEYGK